MKNQLRSTVAMLGLGLMTAGAFAPAALGQGLTPQFSPRYLTDQQTGYTRFMVNFNSCPVVVGTPCSFKVGALPFNAFIVRGYLQVYTSFTGATTMTAGLGTSSGSQNIVAATSILTAGNAAALTIVPAALGTGNTAGAPPGVTGNGAPMTGANGGFDLWVTLTTTVAAPTAGSAVMILEYIFPNDGACTSNIPPAGTVPPNC